MLSDDAFSAWGQDDPIVAIVITMILSASVLSYVTFACADHKKNQRESAQKKGKPKVSSSDTTTPPKRGKKSKRVEDRNVVQMTDIQWDQTAPEDDTKTNLPQTVDEVTSTKPTAEESFTNRQPKYKDAKSADKVRKEGKVPRHTPGFATMDETGVTSNFTTDLTTTPTIDINVS